jgi:protein-disulfide isomerase
VARFTDDDLRPAAPAAGPRFRLNLFWTGLALVVLAFGLMLARTYYSWLEAKVALLLEKQAPTLTDLLAPSEPPPARGPRRETVTVFSWNPVLGPDDARVTLVEFTDLTAPEGQQMAKALTEVMAAYGPQVRVVSKYLPSKGKANVAAAVIGQLAWAKGVYGPWREKMLAGATDPIAALEAVGVPADDQLRLLSGGTGPVMRGLEEDIRQAQALGVQKPPALFVEGYRLGQPGLPVGGLNDYVKHILDGRPIGG